MLDVDYLHHRFVEEWERADAAGDPQVRSVHLSFAEAYLARLELGAMANRRRRSPPLRRGLA